MPLPCMEVLEDYLKTNMPLIRKFRAIVSVLGTKARLLKGRYSILASENHPNGTAFQRDVLDICLISSLKKWDDKHFVAVLHGGWPTEPDLINIGVLRATRGNLVHHLVSLGVIDQSDATSFSLSNRPGPDGRPYFATFEAQAGVEHQVQDTLRKLEPILICTYERIEVVKDFCSKHAHLLLLLAAVCVVFDYLSIIRDVRRALRSRAYSSQSGREFTQQEALRYAKPIARLLDHQRSELMKEIREFRLSESTSQACDEDVCLLDSYTDLRVLALCFGATATAIAPAIAGACIGGAWIGVGLSISARLSIPCAMPYLVMGAKIAKGIQRYSKQSGIENVAGFMQPEPTLNNSTEKEESKGKLPYNPVKYIKMDRNGSVQMDNRTNFETLNRQIAAPTAQSKFFRGIGTSNR